MAWTLGNIIDPVGLFAGGGLLGKGGEASKIFNSDFFTSDRERQGKNLSQQEMDMWDQLYKDVGNEKSIYDDPAQLSKYSDIANQMFAPARSNVATANARARSSAAARMSSHNATPEVTFGNIDSSFAPAYGAIETGQQDALRSILGGENQFNMDKMRQKIGVRSGRGGALQNYLSSLSPDSTFDDILGIGGTIGKIGGAIAASDIRLKENINFVGIENGFNLYDFNYKKEPQKRYRGVMAQEVALINPDAVSVKDGFLQVDYSKLGISLYEVN